jgi:hypothetical protein
MSRLIQNKQLRLRNFFSFPTLPNFNFPDSAR